MSQDPQLSWSRRTFLRGLAVAGGALAATCWPRGNARAAEPDKPIRLGPDSVVLFQGDSITDGGRHRGRRSPNNPTALGFNYVPMVAAGLLGAHPRLRLQCYNRGISGDKVPDLAARWEIDALSLKPNLLSILIGVNDMLQTRVGQYKGTAAEYERGYAELLRRTRTALPNVVLVVCEPFVLRCGVVNDSWFPEFDERRAGARRVANQHGAVWVPFQKMFDEVVSAETPPGYWAPDGVHPSMAAQALMARKWLEVTGLGLPSSATAAAKVGRVVAA